MMPGHNEAKTMSKEDLQFEPDVQYDLSELPDEVVAYAFDQYHDKVGDMIGSGSIGENVEIVTIHSDTTLDYENSEFNLINTLAGELMSSLLREKIRDIKGEVIRGDRSDYTKADIKRFRSIVSDEL